MKLLIKKYLQHPMEAVFVVFLWFMLRVMPFRVIHPLMGWLCVKICAPRVRRKIIEHNMRAVGFSEEKIERTISAFWRHMGMMIAEIIHVKTVLKKAKIDLVGKELFSDDVKNGKKACLLLSGHLGNWEIGSHIAADMFGERLRVYFRGANNPLVNRLLIWYRKKLPGEIVMKSATSKQELEDNIKHKKVNVLLVDQRNYKGIPSHLMTQKVSVFHSPFSYAYDENAEIHMCFFVKTSKQDSPVLSFKGLAHQIKQTRGVAVDKNQVIQKQVDEVTKKLSSWILEYPEQWFGWLQKRPDWYPVSNDISEKIENK